MDDMDSKNYFGAGSKWHASGSHITKYYVSGCSCYSRGKAIVQEIPSINFIRSCRTILRIIGETLADYCIGKVEQWDQ